MMWARAAAFPVMVGSAWRRRLAHVHGVHGMELAHLGRIASRRRACNASTRCGSRRRRPRALPIRPRLARQGAAARARAAPARGRAALPAHRHHLRGLHRGRRPGAADPLRHHPARDLPRRVGSPRPRARAARARAERLPPRRLRRAGDPAGRSHPRGDRAAQPRVPARDVRLRAAGGRLHPHLRDRHRARRTGRVLRAGGQLPNSVRRLVHAGEPRGDAAPRAGAGVEPSHRADLPLPGRALRDAALGRAARLPRRAVRRAAHARLLQQRLLRALLPGRRNGRRAGRGSGPLRGRRGRLHAHHRGTEARGRPLPAHRRRVPRSAGLSQGLAARRARSLLPPIARATSRSPTPPAPASPTTRASTPTCRR